MFSDIFSITFRNLLRPKFFLLRFQLHSLSAVSWTACLTLVSLCHLLLCELRQS